MGVDFKAFLFAWNIALTLGLVILLREYRFVDPALYEQVSSAKARNDLAIALELGRLDFATVLLSIVAILIGLGALVGYAEVRWRAIDQGRQAAIPAAREAAKEIAIPIAEDEARRTVADLLPPMVARHVASYIQTQTQLGRTDFSDEEIREMMSKLSNDGGQNG